MQLSSEMIDLVLRFTFNAAIAYIIIKVIYKSNWMKIIRIILASVAQKIAVVT